MSKDESRNLSPSSDDSLLNDEQMLRRLEQEKAQLRPEAVGCPMCSSLQYAMSRTTEDAIFYKCECGNEWFWPRFARPMAKPVHSARINISIPVRIPPVHKGQSFRDPRKNT